MIKKFILYFTIIFIGSTQLSKAQDPQFSQYYANMLYLNPAFAGAVKCPRLTLNYRNQWPNLGSTYVTYNASYDQHVSALGGGIGVLAFQDVQGNGAITQSNVSAIYSYTLNVSRTFAIKGGFQASYFQKKLNWDFIFPDMIHPLYGPIYPTQETTIPTDLSRGVFDFSAGLVGFNKNYFFGFAVHHLTQPTESFRGTSDAYLPRKYTVHFGTNIPITNRNYRRGELSISPNLLFQQQEKFQQLNYGLYLNRKSVVFGVWLRQNFNFHYDSFIMLIGFVQDKLKFAYSYDLTVSKLTNNQTLGAHEASFSMTFNCKQKKKKFRTISCPSF
jgi:type IX secretion system PorP/SprF family membrane protein